MCTLVSFSLALCVGVSLFLFYCNFFSLISVCVCVSTFIYLMAKIRTRKERGICRREGNICVPCLLGGKCKVARHRVLFHQFDLLQDGHAKRWI